MLLGPCFRVVAQRGPLYSAVLKRCAWSRAGCTIDPLPGETNGVQKGYVESFLVTLFSCKIMPMPVWVIVRYLPFRFLRDFGQTFFVPGFDCQPRLRPFSFLLKQTKRHVQPTKPDTFPLCACMFSPEINGFNSV